MLFLSGPSFQVIHFRDVHFQRSGVNSWSFWPTNGWSIEREQDRTWTADIRRANAAGGRIAFTAADVLDNGARARALGTV